MSLILCKVKIIKRRIYCNLSVGCKDCSVTSKQGHCFDNYMANIKHYNLYYLRIVNKDTVVCLQPPIAHSFRGKHQFQIDRHSICKSTFFAAQW